MADEPRTPISRPEWTVLLVGGHSGSGKSTAAERIGLELGVPWLSVDDLRLAVQRYCLHRHEPGDPLYFFEETPSPFRLPPERLRDALTGVASAVAPAVEMVVENHVAIDAPVIVEGNGILPSLLRSPALRGPASNGRVRAVFVVEPDESALVETMRTRGIYTEGLSPAEVDNRARGFWLYGRWLEDQARARGLPVLEARPRETLHERVLEAADARRDRGSNSRRAYGSSGRTRGATAR